MKIDKLEENPIGPFSQGTKKNESSISVNVKLNTNTNSTNNNSSFPFSSMTNTNKKSRQKINHPTYINSFKDKAKVITTSQIYKNKTINNEYQTGEDNDQIAKNIKLRETINRETLTKLLTAMENRADLHKKYVSAYLTIINWSKNEFNQPEQRPEQGSVLTALKNVKSKEDAA